MTIRFSNWRPYRNMLTPAPVNTTVIADSDTTPTNWVDAFSLVEAGSMPAGVYQILYSVAWNLNSVAKQAFFTSSINGAQPPIFLIKEPEDVAENHAFTIRETYNHATPGPITIVWKYLISLAGSGTPTLTVLLGSISFEKKADLP